MTVYLGVYGQIELTRSSTDVSMEAVIDPADVNDSKDRFSFSFSQGTLITGDLISFSTLNGELLSFVSASGWDDATVHDQGTFFVNVDPSGGICLYRNFADAVNGTSTGRVSLTAIATSITVEYNIQNLVSRALGQTTSWELNTVRDNVDVTALGDWFRENYSTVISGNGRISALFEYDSTSSESALYLYQLIIRQQLGSAFKAKLSIISKNADPDIGDSIFYEINGILTNCAMSISTEGAVLSEFQYVTTGQILLKVEPRANYIVQEQDGISRIKVESNQGEAYLTLEENP